MTFTVTPIDEMTQEDWDMPWLLGCENCGDETEVVGDMLPGGWFIVRASIFGMEALCPACVTEERE